MPLHRTREGEAGRGVLIGEPFTAAAKEMENGVRSMGNPGIGPSAARDGGRHEEVIRHSVGDEKHDGGELTANGKWRAHDAVARADEWGSGGETWGKRSARARGLVGRTKSRISGMMRR
jgi:hypothetical protein